VNKYELAAALAVDGLDDSRWHRLSAAEQRALFGFPVFGKKEFRVNPANQGEVMLRKSVPPGDSIFAVYSYAEVAAAVNSKTKLHVG
jgi:hypothetical protein